MSSWFAHHNSLSLSLLPSIRTLVPLLTYIDPFQSGFDRYLNHSTTTSFHPESQYRGRNSHSYLIAKYGISTFDLITIQLYEPYSYLQQNVTMFNQTVSNYLVNLVKSYSTGWTVKFSMDPTCGLPDQVVKVDASRLLIAFEIASEMDNVKKWVVEPNQIVKSYIALMQQGVDLRGYAYWSIRDDGMTPPVAGASAISYSKSLGSLINNSSIALGNSSGGSGSSSSGNNGGGGGSSSSASPSAGSHASALHISSLLSSIFVLSTMLTQI